MSRQNFLLSLICYLTLISYGLFLTAFASINDVLQQFFSVSEGDIGLLFTFLSLGLIIAVLSGGYLIDKYNVKSITVAGQAFFTLGLLLLTNSETFIFGIMSYFIIGFGAGFLQTTTSTIIATLYVENRASALNVLHAFFGIGALIGPLFSGFVVEADYGWKTLYTCLMIYSVMLFLLFVFLKFPKKVETDPIHLSALIKIIANKYTIILILATVLYVGAENAINVWSVLYVERKLEINRLTAGSYLTYFWIAITLGRFICYVVAKKIKEKTLLLILVIFSLICYALFVLIPNAVIAGIAIFITGIGFSGIFATLLSLGANKFPQSLGSITGLLFASMGLGILIFPVLIGALAETFTLTNAMLIVIGVLILQVILTLGIYKINQS